MAGYTRVGASRFQLADDIKQFKNGLKRDLLQMKREAARIALKKVIFKSPARSGNYMRSHNVGISKTQTGRGIGKKHAPVSNYWFDPMREPARLSLAQSLYNKKKSYISTAGINDSITIYNVIPYADNVEYLGWGGEPKNPDRSGFEGIGGTPMIDNAYHVYAITVQEMMIIMPLLPKLISGNINTGII